MSISKFLIVRREDFIVLGVEWINFRLDLSAVDRRPVIVAANDARLTLSLPPQAVAEEVMAASEFGVDIPFRPKAARVAGLSRLTFAVDQGSRFFLNPESLLTLLGDQVRCHLVSDSSTRVEMPWHVFFTPVARNSAVSVILDHPTRPMASPQSFVGLWTAACRARDAAEDAGLAYRGVGASSDQQGLGATALSATDRDRISSNSQQRPAPMRRLEFSALGGSLSVRGSWSNFEWDHDANLGRDQRVRVLSRGKLYPFGHRAKYETLTERVFGLTPLAEDVLYPMIDCPDDLHAAPPHPKCPDYEHPRIPWEARPALAALTKQGELVVGEQLRRADATDGWATRSFPFDEVEILTRGVSDLAEPVWQQNLFFVPRFRDGRPVQFSMRCKGLNGDVTFAMPLIFVQDVALSAADLARLSAVWAEFRDVNLPGLNVDVVRGPNKAPGDIVEVHNLRVEAAKSASGYAPIASAFGVKLPALRTLLPNRPDETVTMHYTAKFLEVGPTADLALEHLPRGPNDKIVVDFTASPKQSGGLVSPKFAPNAVSRTLGLVPAEAFGSAPDPRAIFKDTTILGLGITSLIKTGIPINPPKIVSVAEGGGTRVSMEWQLALQSFLAFTATADTKLALTVSRSPTDTITSCKIQKFSYRLPPPGSPRLLEISFDNLEYNQRGGTPPNLGIDGLKLEFDGPLQLLQTLIQALQKFVGASGATVGVSSDGITASYSVGIPAVPAGAFLLKNISARIGVDVPFSKKPVTLALGFASREKPFNLTVLLLGGGGYIDIRIGEKGVVAFEFSLEFGASIAVDFIIAKGEVHALGGVRFIRGEDGSITLDAFIRFGGSVEVLGLVSVSVELLVVLAYKVPPDNKLVGSATIVIEIDLTLFSHKVTIPSGEWSLPGPHLFLPDLAEPSLDSDAAFAEWQRYRAAFQVLSP